MRLIVKNNNLYLDGILILNTSYHYDGEIYEVHIRDLEWYENIEDLIPKDIQNDISLMFYYKNRFISLSKSSKDKWIILIDYEFNIYEWTYNIPYLDFIVKFEDNLEVQGILDFKNEISKSSADTYINIYKVLDLNENLLKSVDRLILEYNSTYLKTINELNILSSNNNIKNVITFSPEHLSAGSSILQYFGKLLQEKYPDEKVSVSIKQEGLKVTMLIETPDGKKEEVEEYLNQYGLVITNQITPQEFSNDPIQILELETKLKAAELEIGFQKQLLALKDKTYDENLVSIKDEVKYLRKELSVLRKSSDENIKALLSSLLTKDKLINKLTKSIEKRDSEETKQLLLELKDKDSEGYSSLKKYVDDIIVGNMQNASAWIDFLSKTI